MTIPSLAFLRLVPALLGVAVLLLAQVGWGFGGQDRLALGQLVLSGQPAAQAVPRPEALARLLWELEKRTSVEVSPEVAQVHLGDATALHRHPLLYLAGGSRKAVGGE